MIIRELSFTDSGDLRPSKGNKIICISMRCVTVIGMRRRLSSLCIFAPQ